MQSAGKLDPESDDRHMDNTSRKVGSKRREKSFKSTFLHFKKHDTLLDFNGWREWDSVELQEWLLLAFRFHPMEYRGE